MIEIQHAEIEHNVGYPSEELAKLLDLKDVPPTAHTKGTYVQQRMALVAAVALENMLEDLARIGKDITKTPYSEGDRTKPYNHEQTWADPVLSTKFALRAAYIAAGADAIGLNGTIDRAVETALQKSQEPRRDGDGLAVVRAGRKIER